MSMLDAISKLMGSIKIQSDKLSGSIIEASSKESISDQELLGINFKLGQYNAMMEATSNIAKSTTDVLRSIAQKV